ncbi:hypothetical protein AAVH_24826 [Aphelenchoides avenae]|nr:hypothetical protein AAVH_24826 [Aphelenchus avenae]
MEVTNKRGPERIGGDDAPKQTTIEEDLYYLGTFAGSDLSRKRHENGGHCRFTTEAARSNECTDKLNARNRTHEAQKAPSSGTCSPQTSRGRHTPLPTFDCCIDIQVELPFAPEAQPPIERVDISQDSITDPSDALLPSANPFANWIENGSAPEPVSFTDNPHRLAGKDYERATPIDGLLATNAGCTRKPLKGILKKSAKQVAVACPADGLPESRNSNICEAEPTVCLLTGQERHPLSVGAPRASNEDQGHSPPLARAGTLDRRLPHAQLEERVLTFCDPRNSSRYHCEVRDRRRLDWNTAMKYVRLVAESSDYSEREDYEPVVFEESGKNSS